MGAHVKRANHVGTALLAAVWSLAVARPAMAQGRAGDPDHPLATRQALVQQRLPDVRILDRAAVPERPDRNMAPFFGCLAFVTSLGMAVVGVATFDRMDPKVRYPEHVTGQMRLPILGAVPHVDWRHSANGDQAAPVVEALRGLRLRLVHAAGPGAPLHVTVSSPGAGEGKSFLTCNLALAFADAGYRTLLIDGDIRRGVQHRMLGLKREPGLVDFLAGELPLESVLQRTPYPCLSFMGFGSRRPRAPELLSSAPMSDLMARLRSEFAVVLVDSPRPAAGVDPCVLATVTGSMMLVLRAGVTDLELAATKLEQLENLPVRVMGAVLNDVRPRGVYRYYTYDVTAYSKAGTDGDSSGRGSPTKVLWGRT